MTRANLKLYLKTHDHFLTGEAFDLLLDEEMGMLITSPRPNLDKLGSYYKSDEYLSHSDSRKGLMPRLYGMVKRKALRKKAKLIETLNSGKGSLLDIGTGTGDFLTRARDSGWVVDGVETNSYARRLAKEKGLSIFNSLQEITESKYDVISLWHVLEHLPDLEGSIKKIVELLKPGGHLLVAVPNYNSFDAKHYGTFWAGYDVPRHLWHFSRITMQQLFSKNLILKQEMPMIFDSFYVSLLSEKYKSGRKFSLKGVWIGFRSNLKARHTGEYSSVLYCYQNAK